MAKRKIWQCFASLAIPFLSQIIVGGTIRIKPSLKLAVTGVFTIYPAFMEQNGRLCRKRSGEKIVE